MKLCRRHRHTYAVVQPGDYAKLNSGLAVTRFVGPDEVMKLLPRDPERALSPVVSHGSPQCLGASGRPDQALVAALTEPPQIR
jgi:hypothetical protein